MVPSGLARSRRRNTAVSVGSLGRFLIGRGAQQRARHLSPNLPLPGTSGQRSALPLRLNHRRLHWAELFTGNCLITISVLSGQASLGGMVRNLCLVYLGNLVGASALAAGVVFSGQLDLFWRSIGRLGHRDRRREMRSISGQRLPEGGAVQHSGLCGVMCALCAKDVPGRAVGASAPCAFSWSAVLSTALPICIIYRLACLPGTFRNMRHWL